MKAPEKLYISYKGYGVFSEDSSTERTNISQIEYTYTDAFVKKAKEVFCKAKCNGHPPLSTCTSLGTCKEYDNFVKFLREE